MRLPLGARQRHHILPLRVNLNRHLVQNLWRHARHGLEVLRFHSRLGPLTHVREVILV